MKTRRITALILSLLMIATMVPFTASADAPTSELQNVYYKLKHDKELTVGYLGGSVTAGAGASSDATSWRGIVGQWFIDKFPDAEITNINAAVGATGSYFGRYRAKKDLKFETDCPDLLFIEFAVNDIYDLYFGEKVSGNFESIIRQYYSYNPKGQVIIVFVTDYEKKATDFSPKNTQRAVAEHYGLKYIDCGAALYTKLYNENNKVHPTQSDIAWLKYFIDSVHCTDLGYAFYGEQITNYLDEQLLGGTVTRDTTTYTDAYIPETYVTANSAEVGTNGDNIGFAAAGYTAGYLNGWTVSGDAITTNIENASFAFEFTGTAVGFWGLGQLTSGDIEYTITSKTNPENVYTGTQTMYKGAQLSWPVELRRGLPYDTYKVECICRRNDHGCSGTLQSIFIDGDVSSVVPTDPPESELVITYDPISLGTTYNAVYNGTAAGTEKIAMRTAPYFTPKTTSSSPVQIDNYSLESSDIVFPQYKYVRIEYYFDDPSGLSPVTEIGVKPCTFTGGSAWQMAKDYTEPIIKNKWVATYIDIEEFAQNAAAYASSLTPKQTAKLTQMYILPFGTTPANELTHGERFFFGGYTFVTKKPDGPIYFPEVYTGADGVKYVYVSPDGSVGIGSEIVGAYTSLAVGVEALGEEGGIAYIQGNVTGPIDNINADARGKVSIRGVGDNSMGTSFSGNGRNWFGIYKGDVEFDYVTLKGPASELWASSNGYKVTIGEHCKSDGPIYVGANVTDLTGSNMEFNSPDVSVGMLGSIGTYFEWIKVFKGDVNYTFNAGNYSTMYGGSRNSWASYHDEPAGQKADMQLNGDVNYTFNGGNFNGDICFGNMIGGTTRGNLIFTVNGGNFKSGKFFFGNGTGYPKMQKTGNEVLIVNKNSAINGEIVVDDANLCDENKREKRFIIINNNEKSTKVTIKDNCSAEYRITATAGKIYPVFEESSNTAFDYVGKLLGFEAIPDNENTIPYLGGVKMTKNGNGLYDIAPSDNFVGVTFAPEGQSAYDVTFAGGDGTTGSTAKISEFAGIPIVLPACGFAKEGYRFIGWKYNGTVYNAGDSFEVPVGGAQLTAQWAEEALIDKAYVSTSGDDANSGLSADRPKATLPAAIEALGGNVGTVYVSGNFNISATGFEKNAQRSAVTIEGVGESVLTYGGAFSIYGDTTFKNITISSTQQSYDYSSIGTNGHRVVFGEGTRTAGYVRIGAGTGVAEGEIIIDSDNVNISTAGQRICFGGLHTTAEGHTTYTLNKGIISDFYMNSYSDQARQQPQNNWSNVTQYGDSTLNINGGRANNIVLGSYSGGEIYGNMFLNINGGMLVARGASIGIVSNEKDADNPSKSRYDSVSRTGAVVITINSKEIEQNGGTVESFAIRNANFLPTNRGKMMVIINNAEKNPEVNITNQSSLDYTLTVKQGKAEAVFEESSTLESEPYIGKLLGFRLTPDTVGYKPFIGGSELIPGEDGLYEVPAGVNEITFMNAILTPAAVEFRAGEGATGEMSSITSTAGAAVVLPKCSFKRTGYYFAGWTDGESVYDSGEDFIVPEGGAILTATWEAYASPLYVDAENGDDENTGTANHPLKTLAKAQSILPTGDLEIVLLSDITLNTNSENTQIAARSDNSKVTLRGDGERKTVHITGGGGNISMRLVFAADMVFENLRFISNGTADGGCGNANSSADAGYTHGVALGRSVKLVGCKFDAPILMENGGYSLEAVSSEINIIRIGTMRWCWGADTPLTVTGDMLFDLKETTVGRITVSLTGWIGCPPSPTTLDGDLDIIADASTIGAITKTDGGSAITGDLTITVKNGSVVPLKDAITVSAANISIVTPSTTAVKFEPGEGASGVMSGIDAAEGQSITLPKCLFYKNGYGFAGWTDGENVYAAGESYTVPAGGVTFTAIWENYASPIYVDTVNGDDAGIGSRICPLKSIAKAQEALPTGDLEIVLLSDITLNTNSENTQIAARSDNSKVTLRGDGDRKTVYISGGGGNVSMRLVFAADMVFDNLRFTSLGASNGGCGNANSAADAGYTHGVALARSANLIGCKFDAPILMENGGYSLEAVSSEINIIRIGTMRWCGGSSTPLTVDGDMLIDIKDTTVGRITVSLTGWIGCPASPATLDGDLNIIADASAIGKITKTDGGSSVTGKLTVVGDNGSTVPAKSDITVSSANTIVIVGQSGEHLVNIDESGEAEFIEVDTQDEGTFYIEGAQIRTSGEQALRFIVNISKSKIADILESLGGVYIPDGTEKSTGIGFGTVAVPTCALGSRELMKNTTYDYSGYDYGSMTVPARYVFKAAEYEDPSKDFFHYTIALVGITENHYAEEFTVRPYITYVHPVSGREVTVYGEAYSASILDIAEAAYENENDEGMREFYRTIISSQ